MKVHHSGDDRMVRFRGGSGLLNSTLREKSLFSRSSGWRDSSVSYSRSSIHRKENDRGNRPSETKHKECVRLQGMWMHLQVLMWPILCLKLALGLS